MTPAATDIGLVTERVDRIERLHQNPPVEWDGRTVWGVADRDGDRVLIESAFVDCPDCDEPAHWARGRLVCVNCGSVKRMVG